MAERNKVVVSKYTVADFVLNIEDNSLEKRNCHQPTLNR